MDFPRAWEISRSMPMAKHNPRCSYALNEGALLCDCHILLQHPEYTTDYEGLMKDETVTVKQILVKITDVLTKINQGSYPGDVDEILNEVRDDLSKMQETD